MGKSDIGHAVWVQSPDMHLISQLRETLLLKIIGMSSHTVTLVCCVIALCLSIKLYSFYCKKIVIGSV